MANRGGSKNLPAENANRVWLDEDLLYILLSYKKLSGRYKHRVVIETIAGEVGRSAHAVKTQLSLLRTGNVKISMIAIQTLIEADDFDFDLPADDVVDPQPLMTAAPLTEAADLADLDAAQHQIRILFAGLQEQIRQLEALNDRLVEDNERLEQKAGVPAEELQSAKEDISTFEGWLRDEQKKTHGLTEENIRLITEVNTLKTKLSIVLGIKSELETARV